MGGCASVPKNLKNEGGSGPAPEPPTENNEAVKVELEAVEKVGEENAEKIDDDKNSLGSLLDENEVKKETASESKEEEAPSKQNQEQATEDPDAESEKYQIKNAEEKAAGEKKEDDH